MPVLPFTISYNKGIRGKFKVPGKFPPRRPQNDSSFFQFTSNDIIDIHDKTVVSSQFEDFDEELVPKASLDSNNSTHTTREPKMSFEPLNLHISPEPLISSFPPQFLKRSTIRPDDADRPTIQGSSSPRLHNKGKETGNARSTRVPVESTMGDEAFGLEDDDAAELIAKLQGMDASSFVGIPSSSCASPLSPPASSTVDFNHNTATRKGSILAPIRIMTNPHTPPGQTPGSGDMDALLSQSQNSSTESSAVSGTTLARALISNTFVLSIDTRDSRKYRSGVSSLARSDSATLPFGENPFLNSPRMHDGSPRDIPPVPPMPSEAELLILASKASSPRTPVYPRKAGEFKRRSSTGSLGLPPSSQSSGPLASSDDPVSAVIDSMDLRGSMKRISRISEATTVPGTPVQQTADVEDELRNEEDDEPARQSSPEMFANAEDLQESERQEGQREEQEQEKKTEMPQQGIKPLPQLPLSPTSTAEDVSGSPQSSPPSNVIDYYSEFSPDSLPRGFRPAFSPITEVSEPSASVASLTSAGSSSVQKRRSLSSGTISPFVHSPFPLSSEYRSRGSLSRSDSRSSRNQARLPFRQQSQQSSSHSSRRQRRNSSYSSIGLDLLPPPVGGIFKRERSGSTPSPIIVVRDQDLAKYRITMSPSVNSDSPPLSGEAAAQTFPETPDVYSPTWSMPASSSSSQHRRMRSQTDVQQLPPFPESPMSATLPTFPGTGQSLAQSVLERAATVTSTRFTTRQPVGARPRDPVGRRRLANQEPVIGGIAVPAAIQEVAVGETAVGDAPSPQERGQQDQAAIYDRDQVLPGDSPTFGRDRSGSTDQPSRLPTREEASKPAPLVAEATLPLKPVGPSPGASKPEHAVEEATLVKPLGPRVGGAGRPEPAVEATLTRPLGPPSRPSTREGVSQPGDPTITRPLGPLSRPSTREGASQPGDSTLTRPLPSTREGVSQPGDSTLTRPLPSTREGVSQPGDPTITRPLGPLSRPSTREGVSQPGDSTLSRPLPSTREGVSQPGDPTLTRPLPSMREGVSQPGDPTLINVAGPSSSRPSTREGAGKRLKPLGPSFRPSTRDAVKPGFPLGTTTSINPVGSSSRPSTRDGQNKLGPAVEAILPDRTDPSSRPASLDSYYQLGSLLDVPISERLELRQVSESSSSTTISSMELLPSSSTNLHLQPPADGVQYASTAPSPILHPPTPPIPTNPVSMGESPPPYHTVFGDRLAGCSTPGSPGFGIPPNVGLSPNISTVPLNHDSRRPRPRPRLPIGPRERRDPRSVSEPFRDRNGSVSSVNSNLPAGAPQLPQFRVPSPKFKGLTMEAAKWTFTSTELQAIVSRAIQQSSEGSSIRLLHLQTLDNDIPEDLHRLEAERRDIQANYKSLSHRRHQVLDGLSYNLTSLGSESPGSSQRLVDTLRDLSNQMDRLAEDLHSVDEQIACLSMLIVRHSGGALAMALRKLNKSWHERCQDLESLTLEVQRLEAERDEAYKHAEEIMAKAISPSQVQHKPSGRRFKAGLHSPSRASSHSGSRMSTSSLFPSSARSPFAFEGIPPIPPVPPVPPPRAWKVSDVSFGGPARASQAISTAPSSIADARAILEQEQLYVDIEQRIDGLRRSRSFAALTATGTPDVYPVRKSSRQIPTSPLVPPPRPSSLPGGARLSDAYNVMNADTNAMLATLRMLSDTA